MERDHGLRLVADGALRHVDDPPQAHRVIRVFQNLQVSDDVADLAPLVEACAADNLVRNPRADEDVLQRAGRIVGAVHHRHIRIWHPFVGERIDLGGHETRFIVLVVGDVPDDLFAGPLIGPQLLRTAPLVLRNDGVRGAQDVLGGAVVLLEHDGAGIRVVPLELLDVADRRATERVDGLIRIAHHGELRRVRAVADKGVDELVLGVVGVLVFVHQHVAEAAAVVIRHLRVLLENPHDLPDEVVEIEGIGLAQAALVLHVDLGHGGLERVVGALRIRQRLVRANKLILQV